MTQCFGLGVFVCFPPVNISASHPPWLITEVEEESHRGDSVSHSHFLFSGGFYFPRGQSLETARRIFFGINLDKHHKTKDTKTIATEARHRRRPQHSLWLWGALTFTCWSLANLSMTVMIKSLARAKLVVPILSELSTMKARSRGAHLHSAHTENKPTSTMSQRHRKVMSKRFLLFMSLF